MPKFLLVNPFRLPAKSRFLHRPVEGPKEVQVVNYTDIAHCLAGIDWDFYPVRSRHMATGPRPIAKNLPMSRSIG